MALLRITQNSQSYLLRLFQLNLDINTNEHYRKSNNNSFTNNSFTNNNSLYKHASFTHLSSKMEIWVFCGLYFVLCFQFFQFFSGVRILIATSLQQSFFLCACVPIMSTKGICDFVFERQRFSKHLVLGYFCWFTKPVSLVCISYPHLISHFWHWCM